MTSRPALSRVEFVALLATLFATIAFSIDSMLPALPQIAAELSPEDVNRAQLILTSFVLGMGVGTFFTGPLSDTFGRKPIILLGAGLYTLAAAAAFFAQGLEPILIARFLQGLGAAGPRVVGLAIVRDLYSGRDMARIMSFVMMVFTLIPAVAPLMGTGIIALAGWRGIFAAFILFALLSAGWLAVRQPESLPPAQRRPLRLPVIMAAIQEMFAHPTVRLSILAQTLAFGSLFMAITLIHPIFDITFGRADSFPYWFAAMALMSGSASLLNAALVMRFGMRNLASIALGAQAVLSTLMSLAWLSGLLGEAGFYLFVAWMTSVFFQTGLTLGNLNSITMEPMGHIAGMVASVSGAVATVLAGAMAIPVGLSFTNTPLPLTVGVALTSLSAFLCLLYMRRVEQRLN
ncbi:multidrug effflux MFS transporter [Thalassobius sp. S69A]|uniref:multidrug effflux MFS transporter n=1 Tax=unclassified Thalassovita TaxID=2619711 RepID=UPI000C62BD47|nr:multidrug MFS transporter [Paracoccaceae bacterium]